MGVRGDDVEHVDLIKLGFIVFKSHSHEFLVSMILCSPPHEICYHWIISRELNTVGEELKERMRHEQSYAGVEAAEMWRWTELGEDRP